MTQGDVQKMAEVAKGDRLREPQPQRPSIHSQHSSSVPSTPHQHARDSQFRFSSRSPSPNRGLSNQSPRSVLSEAPAGLAAGQRSTPAVCKFETGAEIRKRRIPYVEGGNEELGPPKKEPKKTLSPDEDEKLSGDMRELYDRLLPSQESEERRAQLVQKLEKMLNEEWPGNDIEVHVFGSSGNLLSSSDSDVDICIVTPRRELETMDMHSIAKLLHKNGMQKVVCRASAKVPIVKCWDPELKLAADLNVNNTLALENTRMIKTYVLLDDRVRPLAKIIKYWTKRRILNDAAFGGTISSYTWICMIINFLQRRDPPILPSLQKIARRRRSRDDGEPRQFADDLENLKGCGEANKETLAELLFQFFRHYGYDFDFSKYVVSVKEGRLLTRKEKGWDPSNYQDKEARNRLCVEEPFTVIRNLGNSADDYAWSGIHGEIRRAFELLADGGQLEKCCEEYEFPPEEKPIFQRPPPKPKPTLTRSASQSGGRPHHEPGSGRSRKGGNRNQSTQRAGNRRASSGASFSNQRVPLPFQSPLGNTMMDYFAAKGDLHNQLYQQYQYLQAQQDALRSQLAQQQQQQHHHSQHGQTPGGKTSDSITSPLHRAYSNGLPSPRLMDNPPQTAPLLPGYLYHYPARYPPPSPMSQARSRDGGTSTNPSSPSLVSAVPALRRQVHRPSVPDAMAASTRSQSQPGRSLPHPLTLQQQAHPGYDVSGALGPQYQPQRSVTQPFPQALQATMQAQTPFSPLSATSYAMSQPSDSAMPKEYVGYYLGQSPSLGPQYATTSQMQMPPMTLRDPPTQRSRRVTPDLMPPQPNGKHASRSPSPLGHLRNHSTLGELRTFPSHSQIVQSPPAQEMPPLRPIPPRVPESGGPVIVNGSTTSSQKQPEAMNGSLGHAYPGYDDYTTAHYENGLSRIQSLPIRTALDTAFAPERPENSERTPSSPRISPGPRYKATPKLNLSPTRTPQNGASTPEQTYPHESTPVAAPLLSPVAEMRTPSPTHSNAFEKDSPRANGFAKAAKMANARQSERKENEKLSSTNLPSPVTNIKHERKNSAPNPTTANSKTPKSPTLPAAPFTAPGKESVSPATSASVNTNPWQQAPVRKGHKKSKSSAGQQRSSVSGQPLPANESERKGG